VGNGSILNSAAISLGTGAVLLTSNRVDGTLTLPGGQTLLGGGSVNGMLVASAGSTVAPGTTNATGVLSVTGPATLNGTTLIKLNSTANDVLSVGGTLNYGGTLVLTNISVTPLAAGNSFQLFNASAFNGSFAAISPATPGAGLAWNTNGLSAGVLSVVSSAAPQVTGITVSGATLTLTAANGAANGPVVLLGTTNLALPLAQWTPVLTNAFDSSGNLDLSTNIINSANAQEFYILLEP
jgi:hypothetical protein